MEAGQSARLALEHSLNVSPCCLTLPAAECVLVYMEAGQSAQLVQWLGSRLQTAAMAIYEQASRWEIAGPWGKVFGAGGRFWPGLQTAIAIYGQAGWERC